MLPLTGDGTPSKIGLTSGFAAMPIGWMKDEPYLRPTMQKAATALGATTASLRLERDPGGRRPSCFGSDVSTAPIKGSKDIVRRMVIDARLTSAQVGSPQSMQR